MSNQDSFGRVFKISGSYPRNFGNKITNVSIGRKKNQNPEELVFFSSSTLLMTFKVLGQRSRSPLWHKFVKI